MDEHKKERAEKTANEITGLVFYACYLYFLTHPEKTDEIKEWLTDKWDICRDRAQQSLDFWGSVITLRRRTDDIRSLPETDDR